MNEVLSGRWVMIDKTPALLHPSNSESFTVIRVVPGKSQWADGSFFVRWPNEPRPERGYYSLENGRVWLTTYRWVNQKRERVEYRGVIDTSGDIVWKGTASVTKGARQSWAYTAEKK
jgi:hypothetical protein